MLNRRRVAQRLLLAALPVGAASLRAADASGDVPALLRQGGGLVVLMRHAIARGTFDPPGFRAGVCNTQRNLSDEGRDQARHLGAWYRQHGLEPLAVRSSEWCRCLDTARLAFGRVQPWPALNSVNGDRAREPAQTAVLRAELMRLAQARPAGFDVWVTHQANIGALVGNTVAAGEAVLLRFDAARDAVVVLASF